MTLYEELTARGLIAQTTNEEEIRDMINNGKATFYIGFDCTADSLYRRALYGPDPDEAPSDGGQQAHRPDRRRHHHDRRPLWPYATCGRCSPRRTIDHNADCFKRQMERFIDFS